MFMKKIALVHDQLQEFGGAERVLVALKKIFPDADVYTSFFNEKTLGIHAKHFKDWNIKTSWAEKVPFLKKLYSPLRFITPLIWESFDFSDYDIVITSSGSYMCKGIITRPETKNICYLHHPPRYLYYYPTAREWQKYLPIRIYGHLINHSLRIWDFLSSKRVDLFVSNSKETKKRVEKFYRMDSDVIYPPVDIAKEKPNYKKASDKDSYYVTTARLARAKNIDILIEASKMLDFKLKIIGSGRDKIRLEKLAGNNVEFLENIPDHMFAKVYKNAKAFLFASLAEEFGIAPIEAMGYGLPVIAYSSGGLKETVEHGKNGYLYSKLNATSIVEQIENFEELTENEKIEMKKNARKSAEKYSFEEFKKQILKIIK